MIISAHIITDIQGSIKGSAIIFSWKWTRE